MSYLRLFENKGVHIYQTTFPCKGNSKGGRKQRATPRPSATDWSQYCETTTNYHELLPWVPPIRHDPVLPVVKEDGEPEYARFR
jgi:hypothetical protein